MFQRVKRILYLLTRLNKIESMFNEYNERENVSRKIIDEQRKKIRELENKIR